MSRLFRFIRNAAVLAGVIRGLRKERDEVTEAEEAQAILEVVGSFSTAVLASAYSLIFVLGTTVRLLPLLVIVAAYFAGFDWAPAGAGAEFFSAAAQVIPVLLLALAVESRLLRFGALVDLRPQPLVAAELWTMISAAPGTAAARALRVMRVADTLLGWFRALQSALTAVILAAGVVFLLSLAEWRCLNVLANIGTGTRDPAEVSAGILAGLVGVGVIATIGPGVEAKAVTRLEKNIWARLHGSPGEASD